MGGGIGILGGIIAGASIGLVAVFPMGPIVGPILLAIGAILGAAAGSVLGGIAGTAIGGTLIKTANGMTRHETRKFLDDLKSEIKANKNKNLDYKLSPRTVFLELNNGKIGVLVSPRLVVFEPQDKIKEFYERYKAAIRVLNNELKLLNLEIFKPQFNNSKKYMTKEMRKIIKNTQDYSSFIEYVKSECTKHLSKKEKSVPKDEKNKRVKIKQK